MKPAKTLLNTTQAAELLGLEPRTLECWRQRGDGPRYISISRRCVRYDLEDLYEWIDGQKTQSTSAAQFCGGEER